MRLSYFGLCPWCGLCPITTKGGAQTRGAAPHSRQLIGGRARGKAEPAVPSYLLTQSRLLTFIQIRLIRVHPRLILFSLTRVHRALQSTSTPARSRKPLHETVYPMPME